MREIRRTASGEPVKEQTPPMTRTEEVLPEAVRGDAMPPEVLRGVSRSFESAAELHDMRRQLRAAQDRLDDVMRLSSEWLWEVDTDLRLRFVSHRVTELLDMPPEALLGRRLLDLGSFHIALGDDPAPLDPAKRVPFRDRDFSIRHPDGRIRHFRLASVPVFHREDGSFRGFRGTARDVTREIEAEQTVEISRSQLHQAIESISEGFALFGSDDRLVLCNEKFRGLYPHAADVIRPGVTFERLADAASRDDVAFERPEERDGWLQNRLAARNSFSGSFELKLADGRWIRASDRRIENGGSASIRTDITELKRREEALFHAKELAESANRAKTEFLANISHELRTPLNAIIGFSEIVRDELFGPIGNSKYREYLSDVLHSAKHLLSVINDILDLSKAEAGKLDLVEETVSISVLVESATRLVRDRADRAEVSLRTMLDPDLPLIFADRRKVLQVLLNLLTNSIKFTPSGGVIEIHAGIDPEGDLELSVSDTGIGMAPDHIETALAPFGQVDSALSRRFEGTGLGLPLTASMVDLHGGTLTIESELDKGTKVTVRLPAHRYR